MWSYSLRTPVIAIAIWREIIALGKSHCLHELISFPLCWSAENAWCAWMRNCRSRVFAHAIRTQIQIVWHIRGNVTHRRLWVNSFSSVMRAVCASLRQFAGFPGVIGRNAMRLIDFYGRYYGIYSFENRWNRILLRASKGWVRKTRRSWNIRKLLLSIRMSLQYSHRDLLK